MQLLKSPQELYKLSKNSNTLDYLIHSKKIGILMTCYLYISINNREILRLVGLR